MLKHVHKWEKANGPVPDGVCLKCVDGGRLSTDPTNWIANPRGILPRLNGGRATRGIAYDKAPAGLNPVLMTMARVEHRPARSAVGARRWLDDRFQRICERASKAAGGPQCVRCAANQTADRASSAESLPSCTARHVCQALRHFPLF